MFLKLQCLLISIVIYNKRKMFSIFSCTCYRVQIVIVGFMMAAVNVSVPIAIIMESMKVVVLLAPMTAKRMSNLIIQQRMIILIMRVKTKTICLGIMEKMTQIIINKKKQNKTKIDWKKIVFVNLFKILCVLYWKQKHK